MSLEALPLLRVGWIGAGRMGAAMARRLAQAGVDVTVWNRTRSKAEALVADGASVAESIGELADRDVVFTMVSSSEDLEQVLIGEGGLLTGGGPVPPIIVDCSTVSTETSEAMRAAAQRHGAEFLASPVSGNGKVVASGKLSFVVSGPEEVYNKVAPLLGAIGRSASYVGEGETARLVKICHNLLLGVVAQSLAEITVLAEKGGVSRAAFLAFLNDSVMGSTFTRYKTPAFVKLDYTPTFTPVLLRKDFDLGLKTARELGVSMPVAALTQQLVQATIGGGRSEEDFSVLLDQMAAAAGLELKPETAEVDDGLGSGK
jgi:3-hydroxyisobutyrate dehydrogenase